MSGNAIALIVIPSVVIVFIAGIWITIVRRRRRRFESRTHTQSEPSHKREPSPKAKPYPSLELHSQPTPRPTSEPLSERESHPELKPRPAIELLPEREQHAELEPTLSLERIPEIKPRRKPAQIPESESSPKKILEALKHGGRSREPGPKPIKETTSRLIEKPEIICWKRERSWVLLVELPESVLEQPGLHVKQNGIDLMKDESRDDCWQLVDTKGTVTVSWSENEGQIRSSVETGTRNCLLFKLNSRGQGRSVKAPTRGQYLVVTPYEWRRDETLSGSPPVAPEPVTIGGYQAHFFFIEKGTASKIAFFLTDGTSRLIESKQESIELIGKRIEDASEDVGPLFGGEPPEIRFLSKRALKEIRKVVVGEEGSKRRKWRTQFYIGTDEDDQSLSPVLAGRRIGWYFLRFYDEKDDLVDSLDFRFVSSLRDIRIEQYPVPSEKGHRPATVEFHHDATCTVQHAEYTGSGPQLVCESGKTIILISPDPALDKTAWLVSGGGPGPPVEVDILVERFWWCLSEESQRPNDWQARLVSLKLDDFMAISKKSILLRLPRARWTDGVFVGFTADLVKKYEVKVKEDTVAVPLRHFCDDQVLRSSGTHRLRAWVRHQDEKYEVAIGELSIKLRCRRCDFEAPDEQTMLDHVESEHVNEFFRPFTYDELRKFMPSLPAYIYACPYDGFYSASNDVQNPTSAICEHVSQCPKAPREKGIVEIRFRVVTDLNEIRAHIDKNLPHFHQCKLCPKQVEDEGYEKLFQHLIQCHKDKLHQLC
jgi:cytochrome c-type biogenesis protein CcmH/NrfF